ncbi:5-formyltetrahydrofolate cyclo-ligase [Congregibacter sp.]|uniref:5-formyltetrahydrofolate cyclo-ligase n=1 Tax=Congregibacter sp. TaxID=2744308 RepID=UPI003F6CCA23
MSVNSQNISLKNNRDNNSVGQAQNAASRKQWRVDLRQRRKAIAASQAEHASKEAATHLCHDPLWNAEHIALYLPNDGELNTQAIAAEAQRAGKHVYLPVLRGSGMQFCQWSAGDPLKVNRFGIGEPEGTPVDASRLQLLLLPTVGWTTSGFRLGMGGAYYDRFLADGEPLTAFRIGLAYDCQREDALDAFKESWDQPLDAVLTEKGLRRFE